MVEQVTEDMMVALGVGQRHLDALVGKAEDEGFEVEIHATMREAGMRYRIALVRRTYAADVDGPALEAI